MAASTQSDSIVVGAGLVGLTAALGMATICPDKTVCVLGPPFTVDPANPDTRTTAIFNPGLQLLQNLGVTAHLDTTPAKMVGIRIIDDMGHLFRAPEMLFRAEEVGQDAFGANLRNSDLSAALHEACKGNPAITYIETSGVTAVEHGSDAATLTTKEGQEFHTNLVVGCDGRNSITRSAAGIETKAWDYEQVAVVCSFSHSASHEDISTEFHRPAGPFTLVPVAQGRSSLVYVERPERAERLRQMTEAAFLAEIHERSHGILGKLSELGPRGMFPLKGQTAKRFGNDKTVLLGEAAHVMPPIGAQGLNLGLRDVGALIDAIEDNSLSATQELVSQYDRERRADVEIRTLGVDLLSKSLTAQIAPIQIGRTLGLHALKAITPLRKALIRQGIAPTRSLPRSMAADPNW